MVLARVLLALFSLILSAIPAAALTLECRLPVTGTGGGYVTGLYYFQHEQGRAEAIVSDEVIMYYNNEQPMTARVSADTDVKLVFTWNVQMTNSGQMTRMQYRAAWFRKNGLLTIQAKPGGGYINSFEGRGTCRALLADRSKAAGRP